MKRCTICKQDKPINEFGQNKRHRDGKQTYCIFCSRDKDRRCYNNNLIRRQKLQKRRKKITDINSKIIYEWLLSHPCIDCGESDPVVLEFDHKKDKRYTVAHIRGHATNTVLEEILKCDIRCANCHRRRHAKENNWYANILNT